MRSFLQTQARNALINLPTTLLIMSGQNAAAYPVLALVNGSLGIADTKAQPANPERVRDDHPIGATRDGLMELR